MAKTEATVEELVSMIERGNLHLSKILHHYILAPTDTHGHEYPTVTFPAH